MGRLCEITITRSKRGSRTCHTRPRPTEAGQRKEAGSLILLQASLILLQASGWCGSSSRSPCPPTDVAAIFSRRSWSSTYEPTWPRSTSACVTSSVSPGRPSRPRPHTVAPHLELAGSIGSRRRGRGTCPPPPRLQHWRHAPLGHSPGRYPGELPRAGLRDACLAGRPACARKLKAGAARVHRAGPPAPPHLHLRSREAARPAQLRRCLPPPRVQSSTPLRASR